MTQAEHPHHLHREINARQLGMLAIGGAIGTGLFFASGSAISQAGPGGAMLAYLVMGMAVYCMMQSLGEMAAQLPVAGSWEVSGAERLSTSPSASRWAGTTGSLGPSRWRRSSWLAP